MLLDANIWEQLLRPHGTLSGAEIPPTLLSPRQYLRGRIAGNSCRDIGQLRGLETEDDINALIDGYARGVMAVAGQNHIAFWITTPPHTSIVDRVLVIAEHAIDSSSAKWKSFTVPAKYCKEALSVVEFELCLMQEGTMPVDSEAQTRFLLCVDTQSSAARLIQQARSESRINTTDLSRELESYLPLKHDKQGATEFWEDALQGFAGVCERQHPALSCTRITLEPDYHPTLLHTLVLRTSWNEFKDAAKRLGLGKAETILRAAFAYILSEYLELDRVILGEITSERTSSAAFRSILPIPIVLSSEDKAEELLHRIDDFITSSKVMGLVPFEAIRDTLKCSASQSPFNALFTYNEDASHHAMKEPTLHGSQSEKTSPSIALAVQRTKQDMLSCTLSVSADLMDASHLLLVLQQIEALTDAIVANPTESVRALTALFPEHLLSIYTPSVSEQLEEASLLSPFHWADQWAMSSPNWPAVEVIEAISDDEIQSRAWSYAELAQTSNRIATLLVRRGWRNTMIGICLGRSFIAYAIVLAIWKSGNCYVPIAEDLPEARRVLLLSDSGATALFSDKEALGNVIPPEGCGVIDVNSTDFHDELQGIEEIRLTDALPSDNCYLLYTSGSTGLPKGVLVTRGNLSAFTEAQSEYICRDVPATLTLGGIGSYLAHASRAFDVHICEMVLGWRHGLRLVTAPRSLLLDNLRTVLTKCRISHAGFVPSLLEHTGLSAEELPDLRYLGVGGEKLSETIIERFVGKPSIALVNAYGPTEVTIGLTSHTVTTSSTVRNIGSAVGKITLHVLEPETDNYVKRGQVGELCVTGDLVAKGYHGRPDAKGFTNFHGQHMYRTGDMVRLMANNCVEYLGRRDSQAKVRGQRLELEEVSIAVRRCADRPANVTSIVTPSPITNRPQLVTFISPASGRPENVSAQPEFVKAEYRSWAPQVLERCRQQLPAFMVPSVLLPLTFIPIQISGKADNRRLVALYESIPASDLLHETDGGEVTPNSQNLQPDNGPLTEDEQQICDIVCAVTLANPRDLAKTTSIFKLGIDSLSSLSLLAQMRKAGYVCSAADILRKDTIMQLANLPKRSNSSGPGHEAHLSELQASEALQQLEDLDQAFRQLPKPIPNSSIAIVRPCLPLQESLVSVSMDNPTPLYVNHIVFRLSSSTSLEQLKLAFEDLIQENEIFLTCFRLMSDQVVQVILKPRVIQMVWNEIECLNEDAALHQFMECQPDISSEIVRSIERRPPLRFTAASSTSHNLPGWLMLSIHHSIFDGASMDILLDRLYHHCTGDRSVPIVNLTPLYQHFMRSTEEEAEKHWSHYLADYCPGIISTEGTNDVPYTIMTEKLPTSLSALSSLASEISTTTPLLLETIWAIALAKFLGQGDVIFGRVMNGRAIPVDSVETMLIPLVTTVPARLRIASNTSSLVDLIRKHTRDSLGCLPYQHTPLRAIQRYVQASGPLFNSMFSYLAMRPSSADSLMQEIDSVMEVDYPLALEVRADVGMETVTLRLRTAGDSSVVQGAHTIISTMLILLHNLEASGDASVKELELSQAQERKSTTMWDENSWTEGETEIRRVICEITGVPESHISKNMSFFALGIDSVISIRLARCLQRNGVKASSSEILKYPSVGSLDHHLRSTSGESAIALVEKVPLDVNLSVSLFNADDSIVEVYRCTPLQTAMIGQCLSSEGRDYVHQHIVTLDDSVDLDRLAISWKQLVAQADILRTSFHRPESGHEFLAAVHNYPLVNWSDRLETESFSEAIQRMADDMRYPNIEDFQRPPWSVTVLQKGTNRLMAVTMHHCLYDGFSLPLLFDCLQKLYQETEINIGSFASAAKILAESQDSSTGFWVDAITGYEQPELPISLDPRFESHAKWAEVEVQTPAPDLLRLCGTLEVTMQTVALLAYGRSLAMLLGQRDVVFGHVVSGRALDIDATSSIIGPLLNTLPFRLTLDPILRSTRSVLQHIQRFSADSLRYHHASLAETQRVWRLSSKSNSPVLFDALFTFNKSEKSNPRSLFQPYISSLEPAPPHYRLNVEFEQAPESLFIRVSCRGILTGENELETWLETLAQSIVDIVTFPDASVLSFPTMLRTLPLNASPQLVENEDLLEIGHQLATIKEILAKVTKTPVTDIHVSSSIFTLGVDSILAMDISAKLRGSQIKLSVSDILQGKTVQGIASLAAKRLAANSEPANSSPAHESNFHSAIKVRALSALSLADDDVEAILPCLSGQVFYISRWLQSGRRLWEFTFAFKSNIRLDVTQFQHAWLLLQQRHSVLRTAFAAVSPNEVVQVVSKPNTVNGEVVPVDKQACIGDIQNIVRDLAQQIAAAPSTLFTPPARLHLVHSRDSDILLLTLHHALYDAWVIPILIRDLESLYRGTSLPSPIDFLSFIHQAQREPDPYWTSALRDAQSTILGSNASNPQDFRAQRSSSALFPRHLSSIETLCRQNSIPMPTLILLALGRSLSRVTGASNPTFGLYQAGRSSDFPGINNMAGPSVNMLPFVVQDALSSPVSASAQAIQRDLSERALRDQTDLRRLLDTVTYLQFNLLVNIVWGEPLRQREGVRSGGSGGDGFEPFTFAVEDGKGFCNGELCAGETSVDALDCDELPCKSNVMLEVGYSEVDDTLLWRIDYTEGLLSVDEATWFLEVVEQEVNEVLACL